MIRAPSVAFLFAHVQMGAMGVKFQEANGGFMGIVECHGPPSVGLMCEIKRKSHWSNPMNNELWENVGDGYFRRTKVPGGWIYECWRYTPAQNDWEPYTAVFVPQEQSDE